MAPSRSCSFLFPPTCFNSSSAVLFVFIATLSIKSQESINPGRPLLLLFSGSAMSTSLWPHGLQHTRLPIPSLSPEFAQTQVHGSVMPSNHLILCRPLLLPPSILPGIFSNELALHIRWPKYWSFSFSISPSNEHPGLISYRMDLFDLLTVQGTLESLLQHHRS